MLLAWIRFYCSCTIYLYPMIFPIKISGIYGAPVHMSPILLAIPFPCRPHKHHVKSQCTQSYQYIKKKKTTRPYHLSRSSPLISFTSHILSIQTVYLLQANNRSHHEPAAIAGLTSSMTTGGDRTTVFQTSSPSTKRRYFKLLWSPPSRFSMVMAPNLELPLLMYLEASC